MAAVFLALVLSGPAAASANGEKTPALHGKGKCKGKGKKREVQAEQAWQAQAANGASAPNIPAKRPTPVGTPSCSRSASCPSRVRRRLLTSSRSIFEPRPENAEENDRVATPEELAIFHAQSDMPYQRYVDGQFTGTTDEIIQWAAHKWGLPEDVMRATAVVKSWWDVDMVGDNGDSFGMFQEDAAAVSLLPAEEMRDSTAFNADYYGGIVRAYFDGKQSWLNNPDVAPDNNGRYAAGDLWGSVGAWFDGRWHTPGTRRMWAGSSGGSTSRPGSPIRGWLRIGRAAAGLRPSVDSPSVGRRRSDGATDQDGPDGTLDRCGVGSGRSGEP